VGPATVEGVPLGALRRLAVLCGLRLDPRPSPDAAGGGSPIAPELDQDGAAHGMTAQIVFHVDEGHVSFATLVRYDRPMAARVWPAPSIIHRPSGARPAALCGEAHQPKPVLNG
jgi:hypothetical protein